MKQKIFIITGATSGIGKALALRLSKSESKLIILSRDKKKGNDIAEKINNTFGSDTARFLSTDLSSIDSVKETISIIHSDYDKIDCLINNAGARFSEYKLSKDGYEMSFAVNYLGPFLLTLSLLDHLKRADSAQIINIISSAHELVNNKLVNNDFKDVTRPEVFDCMMAYGKSKLALLHFTYHLSSFLNDSKIKVNAFDPGAVATNLGKYKILPPLIKWILFRMFRKDVILPQASAQHILSIIHDVKFSEIRGQYIFRDKIIRSSDFSYDKEVSKELWDMGLKLTGIDLKV